jgi:hypothetical protein
MSRALPYLPAAGRHSRHCSTSTALTAHGPSKDGSSDPARQPDIPAQDSTTTDSGRARAAPGLGCTARSSSSARNWRSSRPTAARDPGPGARLAPGPLPSPPSAPPAPGYCTPARADPGVKHLSTRGACVLARRVQARRPRQAQSPPLLRPPAPPAPGCCNACAHGCMTQTVACRARPCLKPCHPVY